jgi:hypothetical protein
MATTMNDVRAVLGSDEPNYDKAASMGPEIVPFLEELVRGENSELASKAASLAGKLTGDSGVSVMKLAAESADPIVRVAAAGAAQGLSDTEASDVLDLLVDDADVGVQKTALKSVPRNPSPHLKTRLKNIFEKGDLSLDLSETVRSIIDRQSDAQLSETHSSVGEMPEIEEQLHGLDGANLVEDSLEASFPIEQEMPGLPETGAGGFEIAVVNGEMPGFDQDIHEDEGLVNEMPGFESSESDIEGGYNFDPDKLGEMPR